MTISPDTTYEISDDILANLPQRLLVDENNRPLEIEWDTQGNGWIRLGKYRIIDVKDMDTAAKQVTIEGYSSTTDN